MRPLQSRAFEVNLSGADNVVCSILEPRHTLEIFPKCIHPVLLTLSVQGSHNPIKKLLGQPTKNQETDMYKQKLSAAGARSVPSCLAGLREAQKPLGWLFLRRVKMGLS